MLPCSEPHSTRSFPRWLPLLVFLALSLISDPALSGTKEATTAFTSGQFEAALSEFRKTAERGDSEAEVMLGVMYDQGLGVDQNRPIAAVAAKSPSPDIRKEADNLLKDANRLMTAMEVKEADEEARNFRPVPSGLVSN